METDSRIYVAGHTGLLGSALCRVLSRAGYGNLITRTHGELDLADPAAVEAMFRDERPEYVFLAAGLAGGIHRNRTQPAELIHANLAIQTNVIHQAWSHRDGAARPDGTRPDGTRLLFVGSGCAYPKHCDQPIAPEALLAGPIEPTSAPFAVSKIAGLYMVRAYNEQYGTDFLSVIPATMYGPNDHFDENGHVAAALVARFHRARLAGAEKVEVWGTGTPRRELLFADDAAEAMVLLMNRYRGSEIVNVGSGSDVSIAELAETVARVVGFEGKIEFDSSKPDGMARRLLDSSRINDLGWRPRTPLPDGLERTYAWYVDRLSAGSFS